MNLIKEAREAWNEGYRVIPVTYQKNPGISEWGRFKTDKMTRGEIDRNFKNCGGMALLMGGPDGIIAFDFDLKYDISGTIMERFVEGVGTDILDKCYKQGTRNGGYHIIFSCPSLCKGNRKLASRYTTAYERHKVYMDHWNDPLQRDKASNASANDKIRVLIETREDGGYVLIPPSDGYTYLEGDIGELTEEEASVMYEVAVSLNEVHNKTKGIDWRNLSENARKNVVNYSLVKKFNEEFDFINFLVEQGWTITQEMGNHVRFRRPGMDVTSNDSASFDTESKLFFVFSTSTEFDTDKFYTVTEAVSMILFDSDEVEMYNFILEEGYGD